MKFNYGDIIYNTTDGIGGCITATCSSNGTIIRSVYPCSTTTKPATTFHFDTTAKHAENMSTPVQASPTSVSCLEEVCKWSMWYDITCPTYGENEGDFETFKNIRKKGYTVCKIPSQVECRAQKFPKIPIADLGQIVTCNTSVGLVCHNRDQFSQLCFNYEIRVLCCSFVPCGESTNPSSSDTIAPSPFMTVTSEFTTASTVQPEGTVSKAPSHSTQGFSSIKATTMSTTGMSRLTSTPYQYISKSHETTFTTPCKKQQCSWTPWYDVHFPSIGNSDGDFETLENIKAAGNIICQKPDNIECRAERFPDKNITDVGQVVTCDLTHGLICNNKDQNSNFPLCYNYRVRILCCAMEDCKSSTTYVHSTIKDHTTEHLKETSAVFSTITHKTTENTIISSTVKATSNLSTPHTDRTTTTRKITTSEINCIPACQWSQWFDVSFPNMDKNGDFETYEEIKKSGFQICEEPSEIQCRSADLPDISLEELQQNVQCNVSYGLVCQNEDQTGPFPYCYNYEIRVLCCSGCASTMVSPAFTDHQTSDVEVHTYAPLSTKTTKIITAPLEMETTKPTLSTMKVISTTSRAAGSMTTKVSSHEPSKMTTAVKTTENWETKSQKTVSTIKPTTKYGEMTTKATTPKVTAASHIPTTEYKHESTSHGPGFTKTTKMSTKPTEVTSAHMSTSSKPVTTKATSQKVSTPSHKYTTESEHEESTSHRPVSIKTTKMSTESGEVTSAHKSTSVKPITTKATSHKVSTASHESTTESEHGKSTSHGPISLKTTKTSTASGEVTSAYRSTSSKPITTTATSHKVSTASPKSTTESESKKSTSQGSISVKTTKMSTNSGEVTLVHKSTSSKPITTKTTSHKVSTASHRSTTESKHEKSTSHRPFSIKTTKMSTESGEVTSAHKTTSVKPSTTKATSHKVSTASHESTTESEHGKSTSHGPISLKTTKTSTASGEVTSDHRSTSSKPITNTATSHKVSTASHRPTTESEHEKSTSHRPISIKTTKMSTESGEVTTAHKSTSVKPITTKATSHK
ncbi:hypothetical protein AB205_0133700, partial [Aquarana catesbeiana]